MCFLPLFCPPTAQIFKPPFVFGNAVVSRKITEFWDNKIAHFVFNSDKLGATAAAKNEFGALFLFCAYVHVSDNINNISSNDDDTDMNK